MNQLQSPPWAAGGIHPPVLILSPDIRSLISFFLPLLLNRSLIHFFRKAPPSQAQGQGQAGLRDGTVLLPLRSPQSEGEVKTSWDLDNTGRGHGSRLTQPDTEAGRQGGRAALQGVGRGDTGFPQVGVRTEWKEERANMCKVQKQKGAWHIRGTAGNSLGVGGEAGEVWWSDHLGRGPTMVVGFVRTPTLEAKEKSHASWFLAVRNQVPDP